MPAALINSTAVTGPGFYRDFVFDAAQTAARLMGASEYSAECLGSTCAFLISFRLPTRYQERP